MNKQVKMIIGGVVLAVLVIWGGHTFLNKPSQPDTFKIGVIAGLTGEYSFVGENYQNGLLLAYELYKKENPKSSIEMNIEDDGFDPKKGLSAYKKLVGINTINAIYSTVTKTDIPVIQGGEQGQEPTDDNVIQIMPGNIISEEKLGEYTKKLNLDNVAVVYANNTTFIRFFEAFKKGYDGNLNEYKLDMASKEYRTVVAKIMSKNPSVIVLLTVPDQGAQIILETIKQSKNDNLLFVFDANFQSGIKDYKRILGDLTILNGSVVMTMKQSMDEVFVKLYKEKYGEEPGFAADWGYDSFNLLTSTYDKDGKKWISNIKKANFKGAGGTVVFDKVGVRIPQFEIKTIKNGEF